MRSTLRAAGLCALAVVAITCTEVPTAPSRGANESSSARVRLAPSFSMDAARAYRSLTEFGFDVTSVRIRLTAADGKLAKDTVFGFPITQDTLRMDLSVQLQSSEQTFTATIELRDASGGVLFTGTSLVTARATSLPGASPPSIALEYSGPGRDARTMSVTPSDITISADGGAPLSATAVDGVGRAVPDLLVRWTSSDATLATITTRGSSTADLRGTGRRGTSVITAITPTGLTASARISLVPPAARLIVVSGGAQTGVAGSTLAQPFVVETQATDGGPVPNVVVAFRAVSAGGAVATTTATTDTSGRASSVITLGKTAGTYTFEASSGSFAPVNISAIATAAPAAALAVVSGDAQSDSIGRTLGQPFVVQVTDEFGGAVAGATVAWTSLAGGGTLAAASSVSDSAGVAAMSYTLGATVGAASVRASLVTPSGDGASVVFSARAVPLGPSSIAFRSGTGQSGTVGVTLANPLVVVVSDAIGNPVSGVTINWSATAGALVSPASSTTDDAGHTQTSVTLPPTAGVVSVVATSGAISASASVTAVAGGTGTVAPFALDSVSGYGPPATASSGVEMNTFRVRLVDSARKPVSRGNVPITLRATPFGRPGPNVPLGGAVTRLTDGGGVATFDDVTFNTTAGLYTLTARADSAVIAMPVLTLVDSLTLFTGPAASISVSTGARTLGASGTTLSAGTVTFQVTDAFGATAPSRSYTVNLSTSGDCSIASSSRTVNTGFTSAASVPIDIGAGACIVSATTPGVATAARAQIATPPANATHVWFGVSGGGNSAWEGAGGWLPVPPMAPGSWPSSQTSDDAYVPYWNNQFTMPQLTIARPPTSGTLAIRRLRLDPQARVDLGGRALIVAGDSAGGLHSILAAGAQVINGQVLLYGNGALVSGGVFDRLSIGDTLGATSNFCASNSISALLRNVLVTNTIDVHCKLVVDSTVTTVAVNSFSDAAQPGWILLASPNATLRTSSASFAGDSVVVRGGQIDVLVGATFDGRVSMAPGTSLRVQGDAALLAGAKLFVLGGASFGVAGDLLLGSASALDVGGGANVQIVGMCTGRTTNGAAVTGSGTVNGSAITAATCTP